MKVKDLVREKETGRIGFVHKIDYDHYGARTAFKHDLDKHPRGKRLDSRKPDYIGPTKRGINDRVLVQWTDENKLQYFIGDELEVISESISN